MICFLFFLSPITFLDASKDIDLSVNINFSEPTKFNVLFSKEVSNKSLLFEK